MGAATWVRQYEVVTTINFKLLLRRPFHLTVLLFSSVLSVIFAWLAGRDARGPTGEFPLLNDCGQVDPFYFANITQGGYGDWYAGRNIPISLNEPWRGGLPVWLMSLGPTFAAISVYWILRDEFNSRRWGALRSAGLRDSAHWMSWFTAFVVLATLNSLLGGAAAKALPNAHAFNSVNFAAVFGSLLFLNAALTTASFFLAVICGTCQSTALPVFVVMVIIMVSAAPTIATSLRASTVSVYWNEHGAAGAFWAYASTEQVGIEYGGDYIYNITTGEYDYIVSDEPTVNSYQTPIISYEKSRVYGSPEENLERYSKEDYFLGCYVRAGAATQFSRTALASFLWFFVPQAHFMTAWSNILGYTSMPGNTFGFGHASKSPNVLATEALFNYKGGKVEPLYDEKNTNETSLFPQGSTVATEYNYDFYSCDWSPDLETTICESNCPPGYSLSTCPNAAKGYPLSPSGGGRAPSFNDAIGYLFAVALVYSLLAAYLSSVFPMGNGSPMKFYFPFLPSYWLGGSKKGDTGDDSPAMDEEEVVGSVADRDVGVNAIGVSKRYGELEALKPLNLRMRKGEVTALLGHNGAGKSTFSNILCCEQNPTSGDVTVFGRSVTNDKASVRQLIGECKQDDFLWPDLSAKEHLQLFGGVRGISTADMPETVQKWLESVDLDIVQNDYSSSFSGGMKRRLSLAIATVGDAPVVVLDEPTTGMDPVSRRFVWKHITEIKSDRVILLTTHAMEEADLLSDQVAILNEGNLVAFGTPLELKSKYGSAIQFSLITEKGEVDSVEESINEKFSHSMDWINMKSVQSGYITLTIKKIARHDEMNDEGVPVAVLSDFIRFLEADDSPVNEFGISNSSLEEVFLAVTNHSSPNKTQGEDDRRRGCCSCCCCCCRRQRRRLENEADTMEQPAISLSQPRMNFDEQPKTDLNHYERKVSVPNQVLALVRFYMVRGWWSGSSSVVNWIFAVMFASMNMINGFGMARVFTGDAGDITPFFLSITVFVVSFMLILVIAPLYHDVNKGLFKMMSTQSLMASSYLGGISFYSLAVHFVYTFITLTLFYGTSIFRDAIVFDYTLAYDGYYYYQPKFGDPAFVNPTMIFTTEFGGEEVAVRAYVGPAGYQFVFGIIVIFSLTAPGSVLSSAFLPGYKLPLMCISIIILAACVAPAILMTTQIIDPYFLSNCTEYAESIINCTAEFGQVLGSYMSIPAEVVSNISRSSAHDIVECAGWTVSNPAVWCTSTAASILPQIGLFQSLALTLMSNVVFTSEPNKAYAAEVFVPSLSAGGASCTGNTCKFSFTRNLYVESLGYMLLGGIILLLLGVGIVGVSVFPPRFLLNMKHRIGCSFKGCSRNEGIDASVTEIKELQEVDDERKVVTSIMQSILTQPMPTDNAPVLSYSSRNANKQSLPPVLMHKLRKEYPSLGGAPPRVALKSLDLHVERGQVLGLLGKNGAGKTTALKILSGMHDSSGGIGLVAGFDVEAERLDVYNNLGNCPQFDCVWDNQSVRRHLEFYARLKGIENPAKVAKEMAVAVGLGENDVYRRKAASLSGGMRRRLSIAVSLLGSANILFLDEPTTGLDPSTRNEIWGLVSSFATPERAVIITTHMMLEADVLCSRIAIVAKGSLKVIGTNQHLKDNYGSGYLLQLNLVQSNDDSIDEALQFVKDNINKDAVIVTKQAKTIHINLPRDVSIEKIFTLLYSDLAASCGINQFLVSQSSLEDVFIALGE